MFNFFKKKINPKPLFSFLRRQGNLAEDKASKYLQKKGYKIIARNFACKLGEVDIIAKTKDDILVFIEVKQRTNKDSFGGGLSAVNQAKQRRITLTSAMYIKKYKCLYSALRFDIIVLTGETLEHYENAFVPKNLTI